MFCRNCGKPIPDDCKFCPYCGSSADLSSAETTTVRPDQDNTNVIGGNIIGTTQQTGRPVGQVSAVKVALDKYSPEQIKKLLRFSTVFKITVILGFVGVFVFFAGAPVISVISSKEEGAFAFQVIFECFMIFYSLLLIGLSITNIVLLVKYRKEFQIKNIKPVIVVKSIYMALLIALIVALLIRIVTGSSDTPASFIPCMVLTGLCFVTSGLNAGVSQPFIVINKKKLAKIYPDKKF